MNSITYAMQRGFALGAKHGLVKGFRAFTSEEATPELDETAMQGAIGIIIAVGGVLIALYIIAVVVGSISNAVTSGNIRLSPTWNTTITNIDSQAQATFNLAKCDKSLDLISKFVAGACASDCYHRGWYPDDRYRCIRRSGSITPGQGKVEHDLLTITTTSRPLNTAYA